MTKIIITLFILVICFHLVAAYITYITISSGNYVEGNPTAAELQISYGLTNGLIVTLIQGSALSIIPLLTYLVPAKFAQSHFVQPFEKERTMNIVKFFSFPLALSILIFLVLIAGVDVAHDLAIFLSNGQINLWAF